MLRKYRHYSNCQAQDFMSSFSRTITDLSVEGGRRKGLGVNHP